MVLDPRYENFFTFLQQVFLDRPNMLNVADVLVKSWINSHVLCPDSEPLPMLVLVLDVKDERDAGRVLGHHLFEETWCQVHYFHYKGFVALVKGVNHLGKFFGDQRTLLFVAFESHPRLAGILANVFRDCVSGLVSGAEQGWVILLFQKIAHHMSH